MIRGVRGRELVGVLAREEFLQDEMLNDLGNIFHDGLGGLPHPEWSARKPNASR